MPTKGCSIKPLKIKLLAGEQKATELCLLILKGNPTWLWVKHMYPKWNPSKLKHGLTSAVPWGRSPQNTPILRVRLPQQQRWEPHHRTKPLGSRTLRKLDSFGNLQSTPLVSSTRNFESHKEQLSGSHDQDQIWSVSFL